jgi:L,D-transpeptidase catalytic domain
VCSLVLTAGAAGAAAGLVPYTGGDDAPTAVAAEESSTGDTTAGSDDEVPSSPVAGAEPEDAAEPEDGGEGQPPPVSHGDPDRAPSDSGDGRRVVYDMSDQRVWLVAADGGVQRSYLVSGSVLDNLRPGSYEVYSRSRHTVSFDQQSTMDYMVRFTEGDNAAIGFHDIPVGADGQPLQTVEQLGTPQSHGCIRQRQTDARAMWQFAAVDTPVEVLS